MSTLGSSPCSAEGAGYQISTAPNCQTDVTPQPGRAEPRCPMPAQPTRQLGLELGRAPESSEPGPPRGEKPAGASGVPGIINNAQEPWKHLTPPYVSHTHRDTKTNTIHWFQILIPC